MAYEDRQSQTPRRPHSVILEERNRLTVTGVDEVLRFDDTEVAMRTSRGSLAVQGTELRVGRLAIESGELGIEGAVTALQYEDEPAEHTGGFWSRLFG